ncbi:MAG: PcfJ domain-containing protein [Sporomusaceae bacterium]|jgi:hypothetical protein|nr:PcfJ domain-containing protein [Sporomusaceae bacterium]
MLPQTAEEILDHFQQDPITKDLQQFVRKNAFKNNYIFIRQKGDTAGYCSFCQKDVPLKNFQSIRHNEEKHCPCCRKKFTVKHVWRGVKSIADTAYVYHFARSVKDKQMITCQTFYVSRFWNGDIFALAYSPSCYYVFSGEGGKMMYNDHYNQKYILTKSVYIKNPTGAFDFEWKGEIIANFNSLSRAIRGTVFQHCAWEKYTNLEGHILLYLVLFSKYPQVEYLSKRGLSGFIAAYLLKHRHAVNLLNWRGKTMGKVLGFEPDKRELRYATNLAGDKLSDWIVLRQNGCPVLLPDMDAYNWLDRYSLTLLNEISKIISLTKLLSYQKRLEKRGELSANFLRDYLDYLRECHELNFDLTRKEILCPDKLLEKHRQNQKLISQKRNQKLDEKIKERYPKLAQKYEYVSKDFCTLVPQDAGDFVFEGGRLEHCVANYAERYAKGTTDIVFLRKVAEPDVPYYTMEIHNGNILQCRGMKNSAPGTEINIFLDEFKEYCSQKKAKKRAG